jgi:hypothetical protein
LPGVVQAADAARSTFAPTVGNTLPVDDILAATFRAR